MRAGNLEAGKPGNLAWAAHDCSPSWGSSQWGYREQKDYMWLGSGVGRTGHWAGVV